jgi:hypothetical protein
VEQGGRTRAGVGLGQYQDVIAPVDRVIGAEGKQLGAADLLEQRRQPRRVSAGQRRASALGIADAADVGVHLTLAVV